MAFKKIPKERWDKMSYSDQSFYRLEFDNSVEKRIKNTVIVTRILALFLIVVLFFIGYAQLQAVNNYGKIKDRYGEQAYCYLCGLETMKKCECQYISDINDYLLEDLKLYKETLAEYNSQICSGKKVQDGSYDYAGHDVVINESWLN